MPNNDRPDEPSATAGTQLDRVLLAYHREFLEFVSRRTGNRADAEEILQAAYARALEAGVPHDDREGVVAWFHRILRNAIVDGFRRRDVERRALERAATEPLDRDGAEELRAAVCRCVHDVLPGLKPEYAGVVREVDLSERRLADVASQLGITVNNATVRLHRARKALRRSSCGRVAHAPPTAASSVTAGPPPNGSTRTAPSGARALARGARVRGRGADGAAPL